MKEFDEIKAAHPTWKDEQVWTALSLNMEADKVIESKGNDISVNDPIIIEEIIKGAKKWLAEVLPVIFEKVKDLFQKLLANIEVLVKEGLKKGIEYLIKVLITK